MHVCINHADNPDVKTLRSRTTNFYIALETKQSIVMRQTTGYVVYFLMSGILLQDVVRFGQGAHTE